MEQLVEPKAKNKYTPETLDKAKLLYFSFATVPAIAKASGVDKNALIYYVKTYWKAEREALRAGAVVKEVITDSKEKQLELITSRGLDYLSKALDFIVNDAEAKSNPQTMKTVADVVFKINHIQKLDRGEATNINKQLKPATLIEINEMMRKDPFAQITDAEIIEETK